jgi:hypothetical protein
MERARARAPWEALDAAETRNLLYQKFSDKVAYCFRPNAARPPKNFESSENVPRVPPSFLIYAGTMDFLRLCDLEKRPPRPASAKYSTFASKPKLLKNLKTAKEIFGGFGPRAGECDNEMCAISKSFGVCLILEGPRSGPRCVQPLEITQNGQGFLWIRGRPSNQNCDAVANNINNSMSCRPHFEDLACKFSFSVAAARNHTRTAKTPALPGTPRRRRKRRDLAPARRIVPGAETGVTLANPREKTSCRS